MTTELGSLLVRIGADVSGLTSGLSEAKATMQTAGASIARTGAKMTAGVTAPLVGLGTAAVMSATKFNGSMANVATLLTDLGTDAAPRLDQLSASVQAMSISTGKSTQDLAGGLYQVISAFGDSAETAQILEINAKAAAAGLATTTEAINLTSAVTKGYGDSSAEAVQRVSDLAFQTVKLGQTDFPGLASAMGSVVPIASSLGVAQEELFAVMATATGVTGMLASEVGTQLRGVMQSMMAPTASMAELMTSMGFASGDAMLQNLGLHGSMQAIVQASKDSGQPLQAFMGSIEGQTLALALADPLAESYIKNLAAMGDASDATATAFAAQTQGINALGFQLTQAQRKMEVFWQKLGAAIGPVVLEIVNMLEPLGDQLLGLAEQFVGLAPSTRRWVVLIGLGAAAVGPLLVGLGFMVTTLGSLAPVLGVVAGAFALLLSPLGLVVAGLAALVYFDVGGIQAKFVAFGDALRTAWTAVGTDLWDALSWVFTGNGAEVDWWWDITAGIAEAFGGLGDSSAWMSGAADEIATSLYHAGAAISDVINEIKSFVGGDGSFGELGAAVLAAVNTIAASFGAAVGAIDWSGLLESAGDVGSQIAATVTGWFSGIDWGAAFDGAVDVATMVADTLAGWRDSILSAATGALSGIDWSSMSLDFSAIGRAVLGPLNTAISAIDWSGLLESAGDVGSQIAATVTGWFSGIDWGAAFDGAVDVATMVADTLAGWRDSILSAATGALSGIDWSSMSLDFSAIVDRLSAAIDNLDVTSIDWLAFIGRAVLGSLNTAISVIEWVASSEQFGALVTAVMDGIAAIEWSTVALSLGGLAVAVGDKIIEFAGGLAQSAADKINAVDWSAMSLSFAGLLQSITASITGTDWSTIGASVGTAVKNVFSADGENGNPFQNLASAVRNAIANIEWVAIGSAFAGLVTAVRDAIAAAFVGFLEGLGLNLDASMIKWSDYIKNLSWSSFIPDNLSWSSFIPANLSWKDFIPANLSWNDFIPSRVRWGDFITGLKWSDFIPKWAQGLVGENATGTTSWKGGHTVVGERGPELVALPPMSRIWSNRQSDEIVGAAAAAGGPVVGTVIVNNGLDVEELAYRVAGLRRRRGVR